MTFTFQERLRAFIERTGHPHFYVAADAGIAPARLSRILKSKELRPLKDEEIQRLAAACGVQITELVGAEPERPEAA
jgi:hypothetical protein